MNEYELRYSADSQFEARTEGNSFKIAGYAAVFNSRSQVLYNHNYGEFIEEINNGAFTKTIQESDVRALWNHNADHVLGRNKANTLRMAEDSTGLQYEVDLPDTQTARDLYESIQRGDVTQSSFGFSTIGDSWSVTEDEFPLRSLREVHLFDVSPVTYPAYLDASIGARSLDQRALDGSQAIERLAMSRGLDLAEVRSNLVAAIRGETKPVEATYVDPYHEPSDIIVIRGRLNRAA